MTSLDSPIEPSRIQFFPGTAQPPGRIWGTKTVTCINIKTQLNEKSDFVLITSIACHKKATGIFSTFRNWGFEDKVKNHTYTKVTLENFKEFYVKTKDLTAKLGITKEALTKENEALTLKTSLIETQAAKLSTLFASSIKTHVDSKIADLDTRIQYQQIKIQELDEEIKNLTGIRSKILSKATLSSNDRQIIQQLINEAREFGRPTLPPQNGVLTEKQASGILRLIANRITACNFNKKQAELRVDRTGANRAHYQAETFIPGVFKDIAGKQHLVSTSNRSIALDDEMGYLRLNDNHEIETILFEKTLGKGSEGAVQQSMFITAEKTESVALKIPFYHTEKVTSDVSTLRRIKDAIKEKPSQQDEQIPYVVEHSKETQYSFKRRVKGTTRTTKVIRMPIMEGGDGWSRLEKRKTDKVKPNILFKEILSVSKEANFLMERGLFHLDLKLRNCIYQTTKNDGQLHLIDFSNFPTFETRKNWIGGTPYTRLLTDFSKLKKTQTETEFNTLAEKCAVFQMGILLYESLGGYIPPWGDDVSKPKSSGGLIPIDTIRTNITEEFWKTSDTSTISLEGFTKEEALKSLLLSMLDSAPSKRPTMDYVIRQLEALETPTA